VTGLHGIELKAPPPPAGCSGLACGA
jgi:hypothetical protein